MPAGWLPAFFGQRRQGRLYDWAYNAISYAMEKGYMAGTGPNKFEPRGRVTRAPVAQVLYNKEGTPPIAGLANPFGDVKKSDCFHNAVVWCRANGMVSGTSDTTFSPHDEVTREQICAMIFRYCTTFKGKAPVYAPESTMSKFTDWPRVSGWARDAVQWAAGVKFMNGKSASTMDPRSKATRTELAQFLMNLDGILEDGTVEEPSVQMSAGLFYLAVLETDGTMVSAWTHTYRNRRWPVRCKRMAGHHRCDRRAGLFRRGDQRRPRTGRGKQLPI